MAVFTWGADDGITVVSTVLTAVTSVSGSPFAPVMPADQDFRALARFTAFALAAVTNGPFTVQNDAAKGDNSVDVGVGVGANFAASDVIILRDGSGGSQTTQVDPSFVGGDTIPLRERAIINLAGGTATVEIAGTISFAGTEGGTSKTDGPYALTASDDALHYYPSRLRWDAGTTLTVTVAGLDVATQVEILTKPDEWNIYVSDRNTARNLAAGVVAPIAARAMVTDHMLSNGAGLSATATALLNGSTDDYANTRVANRVYIDITAGTDFTGGVTVYGMRTYGQIRTAIGVGAGSARVFADQYEQFHTGDVVTLFDLSSGASEVQTITSKTAPDVINFVGTTANAYAVADLIGLEVSETIAVAGGIGGGAGPGGAYISAECYAWLYDYLTANGTEDFVFTVQSSAQGHAGCLHSASPRLGTGIASSGATQCEPIVQVATRINVGDAVTRTVFGGVGSVMSTPRHHDALMLCAGDASLLLFGHRNHISGAASSGHIWMRGFSAGSSDGWQIPTPTNPDTSGVMCWGQVAIPRKLVVGTDGGRNDVSLDSVWRMFDTSAFIRNYYRQATNNVRNLRTRSAIEKAGSLFAAGAGADYQVNFPTSVTDFADIGSTDAYARAISTIPVSVQAIGDPIRIVGLNARARNAGAGASRRTSMLGAGFTHEQRMISCYISELEIQGNAIASKRLSSAVFMNLRVINEAGDVVPGARVQLINAAGTTVFSVLTDDFGRIARQEIVSHQWDQNNISGTNIWRVGDTSPANVTETVFTPFELLVLENAGTAEGYTPHHSVLEVLPAFPGDLDLTVVMHAPRPPGQFGDGAFGVY